MTNQRLLLVKSFPMPQNRAMTDPARTCVFSPSLSELHGPFLTEAQAQTCADSPLLTQRASDWVLLTEAEAEMVLGHA